MTWGRENYDPFSDTPATGGRREAIELVGTHLRLNGIVTLGRFSRLSDMINSSRGYIRVIDARLMRRNGDPTNLILPEMMVDQDEIAFIAQVDPEAAVVEADPDVPAAPASPGDVWSGGGGAFSSGDLDRPKREFILFTPGHTVTGKLQIYGGTDIAGFVDASDPRFVPMVDATARSLADRRVISHFKFLLVNRTQMLAASEVGRVGDVVLDDVPEL
jgi:hypothetical protein